MRETPFKFLVAVIAILSSSNAIAEANWAVVSDTDRMVYYIDTQSIKRSGQLVRVWSLIEYKTPQQNGSFLTKSFLSLEEYDCKEDRIRTLSQTLYSGSMRQGDKYSIDLSNEKWGYIAPNTISSSIYKIACKKK